MKAASISEIKKELKTLSQEQLLEVCMRLAKYKKDNKELIDYVLFESQNETSYVNSVKEEITEQLKGINGSVYLAKKTMRKALRTANKYIKYSGSKQTELDILIHFCKTMKATNVRISHYPMLNNMYLSQLKKIQKALSSLHEDIQSDYTEDLNSLGMYA